MSKSGVKPRASEPVRRPSGQANQVNGPTLHRKASGPAGGSNKFYSGPTVPAPSAASAKENVRDALDKAGKTVVKGAKMLNTQDSKRKVVRTARRHPYSLISLISALPALLFFSLFSTVLCPHPSQTQSFVSRHAHSLLGLGTSSTSSSLRDTLCAPAYAYHDAVLSPYVYPALARAQERIESHPLYTESFVPVYEHTSALAHRTWEGPVRPIVQRIQKGARRIYLTFIEPHLPYLRAQYHALTAPYYARASAVYGKHVERHVNTAQKYALAGAQGVRKGYNDVSTHPVTRRAGVLGGKGYREASRRSGQAYVYAKPRLIAAVQEVQRRWEVQVKPALIRGAKAGLERLDKGTAVMRKEIAKQYKTHLDPHLSPYITHARTALAPYTTLLVQRIYNPYIRPTVEYYFPPPAKPLPPRSFWQMISDFLPAAGLHAAEQKGSMYPSGNGGKAKSQASSASRAGKSATKEVKSATKSAKATASLASKVVNKSASAAAEAASKSAVKASEAAKSAASAASASAQSAASVAAESARSASAVAEKSRRSVLAEAGATVVAAGNAAESLANQAASSASSASDNVKSGASTASGSVVSAASVAGDKVGSATDAAAESASSLASDGASVVSSASATAASVASTASGVVSQGVHSASSAVESGARVARDTAESVVEQASESVQSVSSVVTDAASTASATVSSAASAASQAGSSARNEVERTIGSLVGRLENAVSAAEKQLVSSIVGTYETFQAETFPKMHSNNKGELAKDIDYVLGGLDKLYSSSTALTADQIDKSGRQAEARVNKKYQTIRQRGKEVRRVIGDMSKPYLLQAQEGVEGLEKDVRDLGRKIEGLGDATTSDRGRVDDLKKRIQQGKAAFEAIHSGSQTDKAITSASSKLTSAVNELSTELDDMFEAFRDQVKLYQRVALSKVNAREVVQASASSGSGAAGKPKADKAQAQKRADDKEGAGDGRASILPIVPNPPAASDVVGAGEAVIGKGKEQVMEALSDLLGSAARRETKVGAAERVLQSVKASHSASPGTDKVRMKGETATAARSGAASVATAGVTVTDQVKRPASSAAQVVGEGVKEGSKTAEKVVSSATAAASDAASSAGSAVSGVAAQASAVGEKVVEDAQDALESLRSAAAASKVKGQATPNHTGGPQVTTTVRPAEGRYARDAAEVAQQAMGHDEL